MSCRDSQLTLDLDLNLNTFVVTDNCLLNQWERDNNPRMDCLALQTDALPAAPRGPPTKLRLAAFYMRKCLKIRYHGNCYKVWGYNSVSLVILVSTRKFVST